MQTHKITLSYPTSWLTVNVEIRNRTTNAVLETGVAIENGTTATYDYDFEWADNADYIYIASVSGLNDIRGAVFYEAPSGWGGGGWASVTDIWTAQITDYSSTVGSFAEKFANYGGVSHVIDRSTFDEESRKRLDALVKALENKKEVVTKAFDEKKLDDIIASINAIKNIPAPKKDLDISVLRWLINSIPKPEVVDNSFTEDILVEWIPSIMDNIQLIADTLKEKDEMSSAIEKVLIEEIDNKNKQLDNKDKEIERLINENKKLKQLI
jgi:hypothetical protein